MMSSVPSIQFINLKTVPDASSEQQLSIAMSFRECGGDMKGKTARIRPFHNLGVNSTYGQVTAKSNSDDSTQ